MGSSITNPFTGHAQGEKTEIEGRIHSMLDTQIEDEGPLASDERRRNLQIYAFSRKTPKVIVKAL